MIQCTEDAVLVIFYFIFFPGVSLTIFKLTHTITQIKMKKKTKKTNKQKKKKKKQNI